MNFRPLPVLFYFQAVKRFKFAYRGVKPRAIPQWPSPANVVLFDGVYPRFPAIFISHLSSRAASASSAGKASSPKNRCNDPAVSAQVRPLKYKPQQVPSCPVLGEDAGCCRSVSSHRSLALHAAGSQINACARIALSTSGSLFPPYRSLVDSAAG